VDYDGVTHVGFKVESIAGFERAHGFTISITVVNRATISSPWIISFIIPVFISYKNVFSTARSSVNVNTTILTLSPKSAEVEPECKISMAPS